MSYNLLYIFADQLRYDVPGYAGSRHDVMPYLEELERECVCAGEKAGAVRTADRVG